MPRTGRGGARTGEPGVAYSNRTDLNQGGMGHMGTARPYGGSQMPDLPMPSGGGAAPEGPSGGALPPPQPQGPPPVMPGAFGPLGGPSDRPGESVMTGIDDPSLNEPNDPDEVLRVMFMMSGGNEDIRELLEARL